MSYRWPGNVRELENRIESAVLLNAGPVIVAKTLFPQPAPVADAPEPLEKTIRAARELLEREKIAEAMDKAGGNRSQAARLLRITRATLYSKLKLYGLTDRAARSTAR
jgi:DNA-binding NtrC family response regulator